MSWELTGQLSGEVQAFPEEASRSEQHGANVSAAIAPELYNDWMDGRVSLVASPFLRVDQGDEERTHFDVREAFLRYSGNQFEIRVGMRQVFWGVAESQHLVDIINQTDQVEASDGEDKLGQPMVELTLLPSFGTIELTAMTGFRERTFPGTEGRLGLPLTLADAKYESSDEEWNIDLAARWSHYFGPFDFGVSHFYGTSREPLLSVGGIKESPRLVPYYPMIDQTGIDVQATLGGWLWKLEAIRRAGFQKIYAAVVGGFEYTFVGIAGSALDIGVIAEGHYDDRDELATTPFQDDIFAGARLAFNDVQSTDCLIGGIIDRETGGVIGSVEASRRFGDRWRLYLEYRGFSGLEKADPLYGIRKDDYAQIELVRFF